MLNFTIWGHDLYHLFYYFTIYSFIGWCMETVYVSISQRKLINRGFLAGPFCPIYGFGVIIIITVLKPFEDNLALLFAGSLVLTSALEYFTAFILEIAFKSTWWDYSDKPFNIHGRICLANSTLWAVLSLIIVKIIQPHTSRLVEQIPYKSGVLMLYIILAYFMIDLVFSVISVVGLNIRLKKLYLLSMELQTKLEYLKSATKGKFSELEGILQDLKSKYNNLLGMNMLSQIRILRAFPKLRSLKFNSVLDDIKENIKKYSRF